MKRDIDQKRYITYKRKKLNISTDFDKLIMIESRSSRRKKLMAVRVDPEIYDKFRKKCKELKISQCALFEAFMQQFLESKIYKIGSKTYLGFHPVLNVHITISRRAYKEL